MILVDLSEQDLAGAVCPQGFSLSRISFKRADFSYTELPQAIIKEVDLRQTSFAGANLKGATLSKLHVDGADFSFRLPCGRRYQQLQGMGNRSCLSRDKL